MATKAELEAEIEHLRVLVKELERRLEEKERRTAAAIAAAEERSYWLDRWHLDLNALMQRPAGHAFRAAMRAAREPVRAVRMFVRRLRGRA